MVPPALPPHPSQQAGEGWTAIDRLSPWDCFFSPFDAMEEVPRQHRAVWAWAWGVVVARANNATTEEEKDRALKWLLFLPQALLRSSDKGGQVGRGIVAKRFNLLANRCWGGLVSMLETDRQLRRFR